MEDIKELAKQYWPYAVGGVVGLYLLLKFKSSSSSSGSSDYGAYLTAQTQAAGQNAALGLQAQMQQAQINAQVTAAANQNALDSKALDVANNNNYATAFNNFQTTQAQMAQSLGGAAAQVIAALNNPAITALQSGAQENSAALQAAGNVAANSFLAQANIVGSSNQLAGNMAQANAGAIQGISQIGKKAPSQIPAVLNAAANAYGTYMTGGMSNMFSNGGALNSGASTSQGIQSQMLQSIYGPNYNPAMSGSTLGGFNLGGTLG